jgi:hypothetical protein
MEKLMKNLLVLALAGALCSCGAAISTSSLDGGSSTPTPTLNDASTSRGTSSWIGDECGYSNKGKGLGLGGLINTLLGGLTTSTSNSGNGSNSGSGSSGD